MDYGSTLFNAAIEAGLMIPGDGGYVWAPSGQSVIALAARVRAAALEEAAKVAEDEFDAYSCAGAIRALKERP